MKTAIDNSATYLASPAALESIAQDPYWPKWHSPWWHMLALWELGEARHIPAATALAMARKINSFYLPHFPADPHDVPAGMDPGRHIACHCALGTMYQALTACGIDVDAEIPWMRPWFVKYQLPDGGLNCEETHYAKEAAGEKSCSSIMSTLPCLEAMLRAVPRLLSDTEEQFLDRGAEYLLKRKLHRRASTGAVMNPAFAEFIFPRFYGYDLLRGLSFLADWAQHRGVMLPYEAIAEPVQLLRARIAEHGFKVTRTFTTNNHSFRLQPDGRWDKGDVDSFPLLAETGAATDPNGALSAEWQRVEALLAPALANRVA